MPGPSGVLELRLEPPGKLDQVVLELKVEEQPVLGPLRQPAAGLGLPDPLEHGRTAGLEPSARLEPKLLEQLTVAVGERRLATVWLRFGSPAGYLPVVPWERLLSAALEVAVLRLPYVELPPVTPRDTLTIALCASAPPPGGSGGLSSEARTQARGGPGRAERSPPVDTRAWPVPELVELCVEASLAARAGRVAIEVFAGAADADPIRERVGRGGAGGATPRVTVHSPEGEGRDALAEGSAGAEGNPWLAWMAAALAGRSVDVAHFVCPGYLSAGQGALALAESPLRNSDHAWGRFVGVTQLAAFARQVGAWALHLTAPLSDRWVTGLRLLADQMARHRPGPVLLHEPAGRPGALDELAAACRILYGEEDQLLALGYPWSSGGLLLYCDSGLLAGTREWEQLATFASPAVTEAMDKHTLAGGGAVRTLIESPEPTPGWLASNQRYLEQCSGQLLAGQPPVVPAPAPEYESIPSPPPFEYEYERGIEYERGAGEPPPAAEAPGAGPPATEELDEAAEPAMTTAEAARQGAQDALALVAKAIEDYQQAAGGEQR
jgi:hypothetical protein